MFICAQWSDTLPQTVLAQRYQHSCAMSQIKASSLSTASNQESRFRQGTFLRASIKELDKNARCSKITYKVTFAIEKRQIVIRMIYNYDWVLLYFRFSVAM